MKKILLFLAASVMLSCASTYIQEGRIYKTKIYVGNHIKTHPHDGYVVVETTRAIIMVKDSVSIPDGASCYVRVQAGGYHFHPDIGSQLQKQYFSYLGGEKEYKLKKNIRF